MKLIILICALVCLLLASCSTPPEPDAPGAVGEATTDWYADPTGKLFVEPETIELLPGEKVELDIKVANQDYIYETGYLWDGSGWKIIQYEGLNEIADGWFSGTASYRIDISLEEYTTGTYYVAAYACNLVNNAFDCNGNKWILKELEVTQEEIIIPEIEPDPSTFSDFVSKPSEYNIGSGVDFEFVVGDDYPNVNAIAFQLYHKEEGTIQADMYDDSAPFVYSSETLDTASSGQVSIQAVMFANGQWVNTIRFDSEIINPNDINEQILLEAEDSQVNGMTNRGEYVETTQDTGDIAFRFSTSYDDQYYVWARVAASQPVLAAADSYFISLDGGANDIYDFSIMDPPLSDSFGWERVSTRCGQEYPNHGCTPYVMGLLAGTHSLTFSAREIGSKLDAIVITNDPEYVPEERQAAAVCGNGMVESGETCDGGSRTCSTNAGTGTQTCNNQCTGYNSCQVRVVGDGDTLVSGNGWTGATPTPGARGGRITKAIARFDVVPMQEVKTPFEVGVIAHHSYGIDRVEFSLNNGPWLEVRQPTYNPRTKVEEYWVIFDPSKVADGEVEIRAIAYPKSGQPRVLSLDLWANYGGTINFPVHYVQPGDDSIPASVRAPKDRWLTVKYAPGASQRVWLPNRNDGGNIKLEGLNMRGPKGDWHGRCSGCKAWFDNVDYLGVPSSFESRPLNEITTIHTTFYDWWSVYYTDVDIDHVANPLGANTGFARNIDVGTAYEDPIRVCGMVVNFEVDNLMPGFPGYVNNDYVHTDMFQICEQHDTRNAIYQNIVGKNIRGQGMSLGNTYDSAFVNIDVDVIIDNIGFRLWGDQHNVYFKDINVRSPIGGQIANRPDPFNGKDIVFENVVTPPGSHSSITVR